VRRQRDGGAAFGALAARLDALSPLRVLDRGYALVSRGAAIVRSSDDVAVGDAIDIRLAVGALRATIDALAPPAPPRPTDDSAAAPAGSADAPAAPPKPARRKRGPA
jgi:hypothetical protein